MKITIYRKMIKLFSKNLFVSVLLFVLRELYQLTDLVGEEVYKDSEKPADQCLQPTNIYYTTITTIVTQDKKLCNSVIVDTKRLDR